MEYLHPEAETHLLVFEDLVDVPSLRLILESLRRITEYGSDIAEVVLNLTAVETTDTLRAT